MYLGQEVMVKGVARLDEAQRVYYKIRPVDQRTTPVKAVRCDKLEVI